MVKKAAVGRRTCSCQPRRVAVMPSTSTLQGLASTIPKVLVLLFRPLTTPRNGNLTLTASLRQFEREIDPESYKLLS